MFRCTDCSAINPRTFTKRGHFENHLRKVHPHSWEKYHQAKEVLAQQEANVVRSDEDAIRAFYELKRSMSTCEFRAMMANPTQLNIPVDSFLSRAPIDTEFDVDETESVHFGTNNESTEKGAAPDSENPGNLEELETPCYPEAGTPAYGPIDPYDEWRYHDMNRPVPPPFRALSHYNLAEWLVRHQVSKEAINELLDPDANMPLHNNLRESYSSYHTLHAAISKMNEHNSFSAWEEVKLTSKWPNSDGEVVVFRRKPADLVRMLLGQKTYNKHMSYAPVVRTVAEYDDDDGIRRVRAYTDMNSAQWWEEKQVRNSCTGSFPQHMPIFV